MSIILKEVKGSIPLTDELLQFLLDGKTVTYHLTIAGFDLAIDLQKKKE